MTDNILLNTASPWPHRAAAAVRQFPLRCLFGERGYSSDRVIDSGWFCGLKECVSVLAVGGKSEALEALAFGGSWPLLMEGNWFVSPGLPVALTKYSVMGPDAEYRSTDKMVLREAVGIEAPFLSLDVAGQSLGQPFELLWFGDNERYLVRNGTLEIEDLFSLLRVPVTLPTLEKVLLRKHRVDPEVIVDLDEPDQPFLPEIEVRRSYFLGSDERWRNPSNYLQVRADVRDTKTRADEIVVNSHYGSVVVFEVSLGGNVWTLERLDGEYPISSFSLSWEENILSLRATLDPAVEALASGMRGRLAFDLRSDLVAMD